MKQMREKKRALQARFKHAATPTTCHSVTENDIPLDTSQSSVPRAVKRANPFKYVTNQIIYVKIKSN